jgi:hypothetical protein
MMVLNTQTLAFSRRFNLARGGRLRRAMKDLAESVGARQESWGKAAARRGGKQRRLSIGELRHMLPVKQTIRDVATQAATQAAVLEVYPETSSLQWYRWVREVTAWVRTLENGRGVLQQCQVVSVSVTSSYIVSHHHCNNVR